MTSTEEHFNELAMSWDDDPSRKERAEVIGSMLKTKINQTGSLKGLEYGSGTGLLGFAVIDSLSELTLMDFSEEMIKVAEVKIARANKSNVNAVCGDLLRKGLDQKYDLIFTMLTLHHIVDVKAILKQFRNHLNPNGQLVIIDLEQEDGSFHDGPFEGHLGFDRQELESWLVETGFQVTDYDICYTITKMSQEQEEKSYPLFMLTSNISG